MSFSIYNHVFTTYKKIRMGVALIGIFFPIVLVVFGLTMGVEIGGSMSAYYHLGALEPNGQDLPGDGPMRDVFVGFLFSIAIILIFYKGYGCVENWVLNLAGLFAIGVALIPMRWEVGDVKAGSNLHDIFAVLFFLCIAYVCVFCADNTLKHSQDNKIKYKWIRRYRVVGTAMIVLPVIMILMNSFFPGFGVLISEAVGIWIFGCYWILKSLEISQIDSDRHILR